eukprot:s56_g40.t1
MLAWPGCQDLPGPESWSLQGSDRDRTPKGKIINNAMFINFISVSGCFRWRRCSPIHFITLNLRFMISVTFFSTNLNQIHTETRCNS